MLVKHQLDALFLFALDTVHVCVSNSSVVFILWLILSLSLFFLSFFFISSSLQLHSASICHCQTAMTPDPQAGGYFQHSGRTAVRGRGTICLYWWREGKFLLNLATAELRSLRTTQTALSNRGSETESCFSLCPLLLLTHLH